MEELIIHKYQAETIENALRLAMRALDSRKKETETAMDRELLRADKYIKEVLGKSKQEPNWDELNDFPNKSF